MVFRLGRVEPQGGDPKGLHRPADVGTLGPGRMGKQEGHGGQDRAQRPRGGDQASGKPGETGTHGAPLPRTSVATVRFSAVKYRAAARLTSSDVTSCILWERANVVRQSPKREADSTSWKASPRLD